MDKKQLKKDTKGKQNSVKLFMDFALYDKSRLFANETSKERGKFPEEKSFMKIPPISTLLKNISIMKPTLSSILKSKKLIDKFEKKDGFKKITKEQFDIVYNRLKKLGIDQIGCVKISEKDVFTHLGIPLGAPYEYLLVFTDEQNKDKILTSPSIESMLAVGEIYGTTGNASNEISIILDNMGFGAMPSHSLGGVIDYTKLAMRANLGHIGRHGILIEPKSGANHRIGAVFTNIDNLEDFFDNNEDYTWVEDFCKQCGKCIKSCPAKAIYNEKQIDQKGFVTCMEYKKCNNEFGSQFGCNICVAVCPFTVVGYDKIKKSFKKSK